MKKKLFDNDIFNLKHYKLKMLMHNESMFYIEDYKIETEDEVIKGNWFRKEKTVTNHYLTSIKIIRYFPNHRTLGYMQNEDAYYIISMYNISALRENWLNLKQQLKFFGLELQGIKKEKKDGN
jgi:hypothetical protein